MVSLIALVSSGKGTFGYINQLINIEKWDNIILICNEFSYENFKVDSSKILKVKYDEKNLKNSFDKISALLKKQINDFEVALNIYSGSGLEHMALIAAVLKAGLGIRFVYLEDKQLKEFEILERANISDEDEDLII